jgi:hypothetical protein
MKIKFQTNDSARFKSALAHFSSFFRAGGWIALGGFYTFSFVTQVKPTADGPVCVM